MLNGYVEVHEYVHVYEYEHGVRLQVPPVTPRPDGQFSRLRATRKATVYNTPAEMEAAGLQHIPGTDHSMSSLEVPILHTDRVLGTIAVEDYEREHAFGESVVRLLETIASSMGSASPKSAR